MFTLLIPSPLQLQIVGAQLGVFAPVLPPNEVFETVLPQLEVFHIAPVNCLIE